MSATASARQPSRATSSPTTTRRPSSITTSPAITRGATARSAVTPRATGSSNAQLSRRPSPKSTPEPALGEYPARDVIENLTASLEQETAKKEQLLVNLQNKEETINGLSADNETLKQSLNAAEARLKELYADQGRAEDEMAVRIEVTEKVRNQVRELEKEKRDLQRRYNEQMATFEAERQAFYDNELHLKSRIQSLAQARKQHEPAVPVGEPSPEVGSEEEEPPEQSTHEPSSEQADASDESEPAEMTSLRLELSTLSTSYSSLQSTLMLLQTQLVDLKRVNDTLQEDNESYMILLQEKTLNGQFHVMRHPSSSSDDDGDGDVNESDADVGSIRSSARSTLDRVDEVPEDSLGQGHEDEFDVHESGPSIANSRPPRTSSRQHKRAKSGAGQRGESLADLPITGPGLDLAAELGRAENKDVLAGNTIDEHERSTIPEKAKRGKKHDGRKPSLSDVRVSSEPGAPVSEVDALKTEVKSLKDANKALSLYASKIIDRIIAQEGFEHVLAADYDGEPATPSATQPKSAAYTSPKSSPTISIKRPRPQSVIVGRSSGNTFDSAEVSRPKVSAAVPDGTTKSAATAASNARAHRRSLSFDWKGFSVFGGAEKKPENPSLRPLTLKPGSSPIIATRRKLDNEEDEEDRRERERLNATMKLMGIGPPTSPVVRRPSPLMSPITPVQQVASTPTASRFSFFRRTTSDSTNSNSASSSAKGTPILTSTIGLGVEQAPGLTEEVLALVEAENSLAALDAHERTLSEEIAKGSNGGFTEITRRSPRVGDKRSSGRKSGGSVASTVFSAGLSGGEEA